MDYYTKQYFQSSKDIFILLLVKCSFTIKRAELLNIHIYDKTISQQNSASSVLRRSNVYCQNVQYTKRNIGTKPKY